eukprot:gnl/Dysnectes_brevis/3815_a4913_685.p1 GENE.gnl/Dysnectes_brevis/3815_a4913_685~~gnl/Dysnectes_brevis/3815_a4913_685.p1  ORF type:complete len:887 (+),score=163.96 gnl/Dysnectes_brevis/3815_a4913_685:31-2661(+)
MSEAPVFDEGSLSRVTADFCKTILCGFSIPDDRDLPFSIHFYGFLLLLPPLIVSFLITSLSLEASHMWIVVIICSILISLYWIVLSRVLGNPDALVDTIDYSTGDAVAAVLMPKHPVLSALLSFPVPLIMCFGQTLTFWGKAAVAITWTATLRNSTAEPNQYDPLSWAGRHLFPGLSRVTWAIMLRLMDGAANTSWFRLFPVIYYSGVIPQLNSLLRAACSGMLWVLAVPGARILPLLLHGAGIGAAYLLGDAGHQPLPVMCMGVAIGVGATHTGTVCVKQLIAGACMALITVALFIVDLSSFSSPLSQPGIAIAAFVSLIIPLLFPTLSAPLLWLSALALGALSTPGQWESDHARGIAACAACRIGYLVPHRPDRVLSSLWIVLLINTDVWVSLETVYGDVAALALPLGQLGVEASIRFLHSLRLWLIITASALKAPRPWWIVPKLVLTLFFAPFGLSVLVVSSLLALPLTPVGGMPLLWPSYWRGRGFFSCGGSDNTIPQGEDSDMVMYRDVVSNLSLAPFLRRHNAGSGGWGWSAVANLGCGPPSPRDGILLLNDDRILFGRCVGSSLLAPSFRWSALERKGTSCHQLERAALEAAVDGKTSAISRRLWCFPRVCGLHSTLGYRLTASKLTGLMGTRDQLESVVDSLVHILIITNKYSAPSPHGPQSAFDWADRVSMALSGQDVGRSDTAVVAVIQMLSEAFPHGVDVSSTHSLLSLFAGDIEGTPSSADHLEAMRYALPRAVICAVEQAALCMGALTFSDSKEWMLQNPDTVFSDPSQWAGDMASNVLHLIGIQWLDGSLTLMQATRTVEDWHVIRLPGCLLDSVWSGVALDVSFFGSSDEERFGVQSLPAAVRNLVGEAAPGPWGYPLFVC